MVLYLEHQIASPFAFRPHPSGQHSKAHKGVTAMSTEDNKALIRRFNEEVFNKRNLAAIDEFITSDQFDHSLPSSLPNTREGTKQAIAMTLQAFPDLNYQVEDMIAAGDKVVIRYTTIGTQRGPFGPIPPTR